MKMSGQRNLESEGIKMHRLATELFPLHRSMTGQGVRATFEILAKHVPLTVEEIPSGTPVFDWHVPQEWRIRDAFIADEQGRRVVDYSESNLHVANGSIPIAANMSWNELRPHIHHLPDQPDLLPYRTTFFRDSWGFSVKRAQLETLRNGGPWNVEIDSEYFDGHMSLGEINVPGSTDETVLIHCHTCHPSLANDNLSGIVIATQLAQSLLNIDRRLTYRFVFAPATIGPIAWLAQRTRDELERIRHGLVLTLLGDSAPFTYKRTSSGTALIDRLVPKVLGDLDVPHQILDFEPGGYDERQYGSPGIDLPVGRFTRSVHGEFPEYHTSADDLTFIQPKFLAESLHACRSILNSLEGVCFPINQFPFGEPQLGRRGIFRAFGERDDRGQLQEAMMWVLHLANGRNDSIEIANRADLPLHCVTDAIDLLRSHHVITTSDTANRNAFDQIVRGR